VSNGRCVAVLVRIMVGERLSDTCASFTFVSCTDVLVSGCGVMLEPPLGDATYSMSSFSMLCLFDRSD
jgi:hypothetical protein